LSPGAVSQLRAEGSLDVRHRPGRRTNPSAECNQERPVDAAPAHESGRVGGSGRADSRPGPGTEGSGGTARTAPAAYPVRRPPLSARSVGARDCPGPGDFKSRSGDAAQGGSRTAGGSFRNIRRVKPWRREPFLTNIKAGANIMSDHPKNQITPANVLED